MSKITIVEIAEVCHEVNKAYCESIGDNSQLHWCDSPQWQRDSAVNGVRYHLDNPKSTPSDSHVSWLNEKIKEGWIYGPLKDADKKEHPCIRRYEDLPVEQKSKDYIFMSLVKSLARYVCIE